MSGNMPDELVDGPQGNNMLNVAVHEELKQAIRENQAVLNTDQELWRKIPGDYYSDSLHVTAGGGIGINVGGHVIVKPIEDWHALASGDAEPEPALCRHSSLYCPKCVPSPAGGLQEGERK